MLLDPVELTWLALGEGAEAIWATKNVGRTRAMGRPDPDIWADIPDPEHRFAAALATLYAYYEDNEGLLTNVLRDAEIEPLVDELSAPRRAYLARVADLLSTGWQARGRRRTILLGAVAHALEFFTWNSLVRGRGLTSTEAADVMLAAVRCLEPVQRTNRRGRRAASAP